MARAELNVQPVPCVFVVATLSWLSYQWIERGLYRCMQAWMQAPSAQAQPYVLSRVKY